MDGILPDPVILDGVGGTAEAIDTTADTVQKSDRCSVPDCGHMEPHHARGHCDACHRLDDGGKGMCLHYYFPPKEDD
jgi:hypothetical protein